MILSQSEVKQFLDLEFIFMVGEEVIAIKVELNNRIFADEIHNNTETYQFSMILSHKKLESI